MTTTALLLGAKPTNTPLYGPSVWLRPGKWRVEVEGLIDSIMHFYLDDLQIEIKDEFEIVDYTKVQLVIYQGGTEQYINALAVKVC